MARRGHGFRRELTLGTTTTCASAPVPGKQDCGAMSHKPSTRPQRRLPCTPLEGRWMEIPTGSRRSRRGVKPPTTTIERTSAPSYRDSSRRCPDWVGMVRSTPQGPAVRPAAEQVTSVGADRELAVPATYCRSVKAASWHLASCGANHPADIRSRDSSSCLRQIASVCRAGYALESVVVVRWPGARLR